MLRLRERLVVFLRLPPVRVLARVRLVPFERLRLVPLARLRLVLLRAPPARRRRVAAAFFAAADLDDLDRDAEARPPTFPPFREELRLVFLPRPDPLFFPPPVSLFTVAHARFAASPRETPRSS